MITTRASFEEYLLALAQAASIRGTCAKRQVGCVIAGVDKRIITVNYNGAPSGQPHCIDRLCKALSMAAPQSHQACRSVHAEANALLSAGREAKGGWMGITTSPCGDCTKLIVAAGIKVLVIGEVNRLFDDDVHYSETPRALLQSAGILVIERPPT